MFFQFITTALIILGSYIPVLNIVVNRYIASLKKGGGLLINSHPPPCSSCSLRTYKTNHEDTACYGAVTALETYCDLFLAFQQLCRNLIGYVLEFGLVPLARE